jgi:hypothetical protein
MFLSRILIITRAVTMPGKRRVRQDLNDSLFWDFVEIASDDETIYKKMLNRLSVRSLHLLENRFRSVRARFQRLRSVFDKIFKEAKVVSSDESFLNFISYVISFGERHVERVLRNPWTEILGCRETYFKEGSGLKWSLKTAEGFFLHPINDILHPENA